MRIMFVTDQYPPMIGGVPQLTRGLASDLVKRGHQVWVIAPNYGVRDSQRVEQGVHVSRFTSIEWPTYRDQRIPFLPFAPVYSLLKECDPDVIHIQSPVVLGNIALILAGHFAKPIIVTNHYLPINMSRSLTKHPVFSKPFSTISYSYLVHFYNHCDFVTSPTLIALDLLIERGLRSPSQVISNGIDLSRYAPGPRQPEVLRRLGLPEDRPLILHLNRLSREKRIDVLLHAVARMRMPAHVALVSTGPAEAELRALVQDLGIEERVSLLGYIHDSDLVPLRRASHIFAIPSEADLQSMAMMEAMACGLPIVAADSYALPELVHHGRNGFLFAPGDSEELSMYLDQLLEDEELRARMGQESLEIIADHDRTKVLEKWEALYQRIASTLPRESSRVRQ